VAGSLPHFLGIFYLLLKGVTELASELEILKLAERIGMGIELGESHFREFKSAIIQHPMATRTRDAKELCRDISETLVAFANADGGELYIGVEDDGPITGVHHSESQIQMMLDSPKTHVHPKTPLPTPTTSRVSIKGKTVLFFQVGKSTQQVHLTCDGRCIRRFDRENRPVPVEEILYSRQEQKSREYDRAFMDGATLHDLDLDLLDRIPKHIAGGQSPEKLLQQMELAQYAEQGGIRLRRAALLLFAKDIVRWHPRCEVRIVRISGTDLGVGPNYNVNPRDDQIVRGNVLSIREQAWEILKTYLVRSKLVESIFRESLIYPEDAALEALVNAIAHRDYSIEGKGVEVLIFDDRLEIKSPGGVLSSISLDDLRTGKRSHESRNVHVSRMLREMGVMREMGEGMLRMFKTMKDLDLVPPELNADGMTFDVILHHKSVFSARDQEWLRAYVPYNLSRDEQRAVLLGRDGHLLSTNEILKALAIVDTDQFRQLVERLRRKGILYNALRRSESLHALREARSKREVGRFAIRPPDQTDQYREELCKTIRQLGVRSSFSGTDIRIISSKLSRSSPFREKLPDSLKFLGLVDEKMRPLPVLANIWQSTDGPIADSDKRGFHELAGSETLRGRVIRLKDAENYGFIRTEEGKDYFFHVSSLLDRTSWSALRVGARVTFELSGWAAPGKSPAAKNVKHVQ